MSEPTVVVYRGIRFRRYPNATGWAERAYFTPGIADRQRGTRRLHEEIYRDHHGDPPPGWHVHHADHDHLNNDPANLVALPPDEHSDHHAEGWRSRPASPEHHAKMLKGAAVWHRSEEGRAWHREHGRRVWAGRAETERTCEHCGAPYATKSRHGAERFCSNACKSAARRASGLDDEDRTCPACGQAFRTNRYRQTRTCSRACGQRMRRRRLTPC